VKKPLSPRPVAYGIGASREPCVPPGATAPLKHIGLQTSDFDVYYEMVRVFRERGVPFLSLVDGEEVPASVGVIVTSDGEAADINFPEVVSYTTPEETLAAAIRLLSGKREYARIVIGIDPGERPGVAVLGDGRVLDSYQARSPEAVIEGVAKALSTLVAERYLVRIGHGAPTLRNRIIHSLLRLEVPLEMVDETSSTPSSYRTSAERDTVAAAAIALAKGMAITVQDVPLSEPSDGELRDIQRKSRLASYGRLTISRRLARSVAMGRITLDEAVQRMGKTGGT